MDRTGAGVRGKTKSPGPAWIIAPWPGVCSSCPASRDASARESSGAGSACMTAEFVSRPEIPRCRPRCRQDVARRSTPRANPAGRRKAVRPWTAVIALARLAHRRAGTVVPPPASVFPPDLETIQVVPAASPTASRAEHGSPWADQRAPIMGSREHAPQALRPATCGAAPFWSRAPTLPFLRRSRGPAAGRRFRGLTARIQHGVGSAG